MSDTQKVPNRSELAVEYTWDLATIYASDAAWEAALGEVEQRIPEITALQGTLGASAANLVAALRGRDDVAQRLYKLYAYASHLRDSDGTNPVGQALNERAGSFVARVSAALAFVEPEILAIPEATLQQWIDATPDLQVYAYELEKLSRQRAHVRSAEVEELIAQFGDVTRAPYEIYEVLSDSDMPFPSITDAKGNTVELSQSRYGLFIEDKDRRVRHDAFKGLYGAYEPFRNTIATALSSSVRSQVLEARVRRYQSSLEAALKPNEIPLEVYHNLVDTVEANLPKLHRYMGIRKQLMNLDDLHIYDLYTPPVPDIDITVPYNEATDTLRAAFAPLGDAYGSALGQAFTGRWIDVYENTGKRSGAYSGGTYGTPPFILLNYQGRLDDMFTLAHELGHSMHSFFTRRTQPFAYGNYTIFVAEVASTLNEALLVSYLVANRDDEALRRRLLVQQLENVRLTLIRQVMFASFELDMHQRVEAGEALTADSLSERYRALVGRYHGPEVTLDDEIAFEWARIPHFYYNFYVYQYATGISAALALHKQITEEGQPAVDRYLRFLSGGSSQSSINLLRGAGVDMTSTAPVQAAMDAFDGLLDELERL